MTITRPGSSAFLHIRSLGVLLSVLLGLFVPAANAQPEGPLSARGVVQKTPVRPGEQVAIAIEITHEEGYHAWPSIDQDVLPSSIAKFADRMSITLDGKPVWARVDGIQWPEPHKVTVAHPDNGGKVEAECYSGVAVAFVRIEVLAPAAPGDYTADFIVHGQACNETLCANPQNLTVKVPITIAPATSTASPAANEIDLFKTYDLSQWGKTSPKNVRFDVFGWSFTIDAAGAGLILLLLVAGFGGFLLNLTPCVLPVIPIKIMSLSQGAGNPRKCLMLGVIMSCGVVAFWLALGSAIAFISGFSAINQLFQNSWFPLGVGIFMLCMAIGMLGAFSIQLPGFVYAINPSNETAPGAFVFGIMTAILSTPCTAPFMGAAAAWAATQPKIITLLTFSAIGIGMAAPYLILAAFPKWLSRVPRAGRGGEVVKQTIGILMLAVATFFLGTPIAQWLATPPDPASRLYWWLVAAFVIAAMVFLIVMTFKLTRSPGRRAAFTIAGLAIAALAGFVGKNFASHGPVRWTYYTDERFDNALKSGRVVVMDFTAEWCINCRSLESAVLFHGDIFPLLNDDTKVVSIKADVGSNPAAQKKLAEIKWPGIPLLWVMGPGLSQPEKLDTYSVDQLRDLIRRASGPGATANSATP